MVVKKLLLFSISSDVLNRSRVGLDLVKIVKVDFDIIFICLFEFYKKGLVYYVKLKDRRRV